MPKTMETASHLLFSIFALAFLLFVRQAAAHGGRNTAEIDHAKGIIGAIVDSSSRIGKEERVAIEMAIEDFNNQTNRSFILQVTDTQGKPLQAAHAARRLINTKKVQAILGPHTWEESLLIADVCSQARISFLCFADSTPEWATARWPFLIQASPSQYAQMKALAAIVQSWGWHRVTLIYEDMNSASNVVITHLSSALREVGAEIGQLLALPPFPSSSFSEELQKLKEEQGRVFVVHVSLPLAIHLFTNAKKMEMMAKDYVWITTDTITSLVHSIDASTISLLQGIVGVKSYFPETESHFQDFEKRFSKRFSTDHPEEEKHEPGIFAVQAYDATWVVALALVESNTNGQQLLENISSIDLNGLSGKVQFKGRKSPPAHIFQIVNVFGNGYKDLGFWSDGRGFSETVDERAYNSSTMENLGLVFWPGGPRHTPRGWTLPTNTNPLRVGVPIGSSWKQFVNVEYDNHTENYSYTGFSIETFKAMIEHLPYSLPYEFFPFEGTYDDLVKQVYLKKFDAIAGDVAILARRYQYVEFTHPYTDTGLVMVVPVRSEKGNKAWLFMKPFTNIMWVLIAVICIYNGFVVWVIERNHCPELKGSTLNQMGTLLWLAFTSLSSSDGGRFHSNLSRMAMVVWLFVALVITQSYMASLTSMLTVQQLQPTIRDVEALKYGNALVGYCRGSYLQRYLVDVFGFKPNKVKNFSSPREYAQALRSGEIAAAFLDVPTAKVFLAQYCKSFVLAGPAYKIGGFGFVFPKGSPMLPDINEALLSVSESGKLRELEDTMTSSEKCLDAESDYENASLSLNNFWILFIITGGTSTVSLVIYAILGMWNFNDMLEHNSIWRLIFATLRDWGRQRR